MNSANYCPTILLVDDDPACTSYWREKFHQETSVGVVVANALHEGKRILDDRDVNIDGIIADIYFMKGTEDEENDLYDGLDLLAYGYRQYPSTRRYTLSWFAEQNEWQKKAEELGLQIHSWIQKTYYIGDESKAPWAIIERDLITTRWRDDPATKRRAEELGLGAPEDLDKVSEFVRKLHFPTKTYIQDLGDSNFFVKKPIEVLYYREPDGHVRASASQLGLLLEGEGESVDEALTNLAEIITLEKEEFDNEPESKIVGYAKLVKERLDACIARKNRDDSKNKGC